jgi:hypothetical protein
LNVSSRNGETEVITRFEIAQQNLVTALRMAEFVATNRVSRYQLQLAREAAQQGQMNETRYRLFTAFDGDLYQIGARNVLNLLLAAAPEMAVAA